MGKETCRLYGLHELPAPFETSVYIGPAPTRHDVFAGHVFVCEHGRERTVAHTQRALEEITASCPEGRWWLLPSDEVRAQNPAVPLLGAIGE